MESVSLSSSCFGSQIFLYNKVLDRRFHMRGDFLLASFVNCT
ncbi:hypothetical protein IHE45_11G034700 [Dioscorea alata]|uniref:Uncharacterized protein n=1 Tax=Dioscorea alata TaxID=55571 RepID=A0ACB7V604_DIOAL|nr:hypothetical protein IHE45_11G034700 [Dioscorea alata]